MRPLEESIRCNEQNYPEWETLTRVHFRFAFYSQLVIATGCMIFFDQYLQTGCHPLGWKESAVRFAYSFNWLLFCWVAIAAAIARRQLWRRIICVIASCVLTWVIHEAHWGAIVRY
jgi:hypothetical protein